MISPRDMIGEAGAEAYFSLGRSDYIVPLTNRRYSQPFVDLLAAGVKRELSSSRQPGKVTQNFTINANDPSLVAAMVARRQKSAWERVSA